MKRKFVLLATTAATRSSVRFSASMACFRINHRSGTVERQIQLEITGYRMRGAKGKLFAHGIVDVDRCSSGRPSAGLFFLRAGSHRLLARNRSSRWAAIWTKRAPTNTPLRHPVDELVGQNL